MINRLTEERELVEVVYANQAAYRSQTIGDKDVQCRGDGQPEGHFGFDAANYEEWFGVSVCEPASNSDAEGNGREAVPGQKRKRNVREEGYNEVLGKKASKQILTWFPRTADELKNTPDFINEFADLYWSRKKFDAIVPVAMDYAKRVFLSKTAQETFNYQYDHPLHFYRDGVKYYAPLFSSQVLGRLILNQSKNDVEEAKKFVQNLLLVLNKAVPKVNTFLMVSPPSSGKTWLVNSLTKNFWAVGAIQNNEKNGSPFIYQDAVGMRVNIWNECILNGIANVETSKEIWEGQDTSVQVKHEKGKFLKRTPLFVTCNAEPWTFAPKSKQAFLDRCFYYKWVAQPDLIQFTGYPVPIAWKLILDQFEDELWWNDLPEYSELIEDQDNHSFANWLKETSTSDEWIWLNSY